MLNLLLLTLIIYFLLQKINLNKGFLEHLILLTPLFSYIYIKNAHIENETMILSLLVLNAFVLYFLKKDSKEKAGITPIAISWLCFATFKGHFNLNIYILLGVIFLVFINNISVYLTKERVFIFEFLKLIFLFFIANLIVRASSLASWLELSELQSLGLEFYSSCLFLFVLNENVLLKKIQKESFSLRSVDRISYFLKSFTGLVFSFLILLPPLKIGALKLTSLWSDQTPVLVLISILVLSLLWLWPFLSKKEEDSFIAHELAGLNSFSFSFIYIFGSVSIVELFTFLLLNFLAAYYFLNPKRKKLSYLLVIASPLSPFLFYKLSKLGYIANKSPIFVFMTIILILIPTIIYCLRSSVKRVEE